MRLQTIDPGNHIVNNTPFGRRLRRFMRKDEQRDLLPSDLHWRSGGAWVLADALVKWSGQRLSLACLADHTGELRHVVAVAPDMGAFIDADGVAGAVELMAKMAVLRHAPNVMIEDFDPKDAAHQGWFYQQDLSLDLAMRLLHQFGRYHRHQLLPAPKVATGDRSADHVAAIGG